MTATSGLSGRYVDCPLSVTELSIGAFAITAQAFPWRLKEKGKQDQQQDSFSLSIHPLFVQVLTIFSI
jgi:hypothetical protein